MEAKYTTAQQIAELQKEMEEARARITNRKSRKSMRHKTWKIMNWTLFILLFIGLGTILTTVLVAKSSGKTPSVLGYQLYVVQSGSMIPTLHIGTLILSKAFDESLQLKKGDVVTFTSDGMTVTHRIIEVLSANGQIQYRTKGDNPENAVDQGLLSADRIKAVMIMRIPFT